ncbi:uncharacterized protein LOC110241421 [Exaiptasia diaphana]|uniref:Uncharacterized protein n=1 Tax=Exaiptasia diaphana TaxID=2652724 RepID=A0A913YMZ6_EXADI|nr:uncharacterized protein LOC110241421 [Exaiptasia diaphana]
MLSKGLQTLYGTPPSHNIRKISRQWTIGPIVDKSTLRKEVRDFCGQFPVYRLEPFTPDSVSYGKTGRVKRALVLLSLCANSRPPSCHYDKWLYKCKIAGARSVYSVVCKHDTKRKIFNCGSLTAHQLDSIICCNISCP